MAIGLVILALFSLQVIRMDAIDLNGTTAPDNPAANIGRLYYDSVAKVIKCLNSDGTSCAPGSALITDDGSTVTIGGNLKVNGAMTFPGTVLRMGSQTSPVASSVEAHGGNLSSLPGCFGAFNNADTINAYLCSSATNGRMMMMQGVGAAEQVQNFVELPPLFNPQSGPSYAINANIVTGPIDYGRIVTRTNAGSMTDTIGRAGGGSGALTEFAFGTGWHTTLQVLPGSVGSDTLTTNGSLFIGCDSVSSNSVVIAPGNSITLSSNGTDYNCIRFANH